MRRPHPRYDTVRHAWVPRAGGRLKVLVRGPQTFLLALLHTIARPQEIRALQWKQLVLEPVALFLLTEFKARKLRKDRKTAVRRVLLDDTMVGLLAELADRRQPGPEDFGFLDRRGPPWTANAVRCRLRRRRQKLNLPADANGENVVAYTLRHTPASHSTEWRAVTPVRSEIMPYTISFRKTQTLEDIARKKEYERACKEAGHQWIPIYPPSGVLVLTEVEEQQAPAVAKGPPIEDREIYALAFLAKHPDWSIQEIAEAIGAPRTSLYRCKLFMKRWTRHKASQEQEFVERLPRGSKPADPGNKRGTYQLEAWRGDEQEDDE